MVNQQIKQTCFQHLNIRLDIYQNLEIICQVYIHLFCKTRGCFLDHGMTFLNQFFILTLRFQAVFLINIGIQLSALQFCKCANPAR